MPGESAYAAGGNSGSNPESNVHRDYLGAKFGMWLFLFTEVLLFGGMFLLYSVFRSRFPLDFHKGAEELNVALGAVNTLVLLTSSLSMAAAITAMQKGSARLSLYLQGTTVALAGVFLINKYYEWGAKIGHDIYPGSEHMMELPHGEIIFYSLYYVMTGLHGLHVIIGMIVILFVMRFTANGVINSGDYIKLENSGLYWHLVDLIWIYLFPLFYLIT